MLSLRGRVCQIVLLETLDVLILFWLEAIATNSKKLVAKGIATRSKDATGSSWHRY